MKETGYIRRIDDLGRVVIPKAVRKSMGIFEGDPLEIYPIGDCAILRKHQEDSTSGRLKNPYLKAERVGVIYVCETSDCEDGLYFRDHAEPHVYFVVDADTESMPQPCPICGSVNNVYEHARGLLFTTEVLNWEDGQED